MKMRATLVATAAAALALAGCGGSSGITGSTGQGGFKAPPMKAVTHLGPGEGQVNLISWPGYVEDGSSDKSVDWVHPFEKATGCMVKNHAAGTSDEMVNLMKTGQYDAVSASGDATLRLIAAGSVQPINTKLIPSYKDVFPGLKMKPWNSVNGVAYGVPHGRGANVLMYRTDLVKPAPTSWDVVWNKASPYKGKVTAYDSPIYIADAAVYLMAHRPDLKIKDPYALDDKQFNAAVALLKKQNADIGEYWSDALKQVQSFKSGDLAVGTSWQYNVNLAQSEKAPVDAVLPSEGSTGWSDTWMIAAHTKHLTCAYKWLNWIISPKVNAQVAEWFGEAPSDSKSCALTSDKNFCTTYHANDEAYFKKIWYWTTPIKQCLDGRTDVSCKTYADWTTAWQEIKG
jgi:putative spermidine/putrescine transport system substrate-binding protein